MGEKIWRYAEVVLATIDKKGRNKFDKILLIYLTEQNPSLHKYEIGKPHGLF